MLFLFLWTINIIAQIEWPWEDRPPEEWYEGPSLLLWVLGWIFLFIGLTALIVLVLYTRYGREISIRLSIITIVVASIFLGFGFHFLLINFGY